MSRGGYRGPQLPKVLLDQVQNGNGANHGHRDLPRKDRRRAERQQKKQAARATRPVEARRVLQPSRTQQTRPSAPRKDVSSGSPEPPTRRLTKDAPQPVKSILKKTRLPAPEPAPRDIQVSVDDNDDDDNEQSGDESDGSFVISRQAAKAGLEDEDAEIAALERRLGARGGKTKAKQDDDLDWLMGGSDSEDEERGVKRKRPDDQKWLRDKRRKAGGAAEVESEEDRLSDSEDDEGLFDNSEADEAPDESPSGDDFADFDPDDGDDDDGGEQLPVKRQRENPYVAPVASHDIPKTKYIPPSLRLPASSDEEALKRLRRQMQGQLNRLSEANLVTILQAVEQLYTNNARQHVTSTLVDLLVSLVTDRSALNDTFLILHAGFAAALYKVVGTDFGAQLVEKIVEAFDGFRSKTTPEAKECLNLLAFLANLYAFQVISSVLIFDYVRLLLDGMSETNTELLLRLIRTSGTQLRQEDPSSLKDIVLQLQRNVADTGEANLSVRTKFMIETINNLKNNRMKTGAAGSALAAEHTTQMKKILGSLNNTRSIKASEPLRITLADVRDAEKKGKWWLVGASYHDPAKMANGSTGTKAAHDVEDAAYDSETPGHVNLHRLARQQGMNTDVRRAIFMAIMSASDYKDAYVRLTKLSLKSKQELEVPRVLLKCVMKEGERAYNAYYALVAGRLCKAEKRMAKSLGFQLLDVLRRIEGEGGDEEDEEVGVKQVVAVAKFYGTLIAAGSLMISVLKKIEFGFLQHGQQQKMKIFAEVLLTTVFKQLRLANKRDENGFTQAVETVFGQADGATDMIEGLQTFLRGTVAKAELANGKRELEAVKLGCDIAMEALTQASKTAAMSSEDSE